MTEHVRTSYKKHRRATWAAAIAVLAIFGLAVVIPAIGATTYIDPPAQPSGVRPQLVNVGGSNFNCTTNVGAAPGTYQTFQVPNPPQSRTRVQYDSTNTASMPFPLPAGIKFELFGLGGSSKGKFFAFKATGARVFHVGVKGGTDSAWYDYTPAGVSEDGATLATAGGDYPYPTTSTGLHATKKDSSTFYVASYTTFCYKPVVKIEGNVYEDTNADGAKNGSEGAFATARTVTLDNGASTTTDSDGNYTFYVATGGTYTVCVTQNLSAEAQTQPSGNAAPVGSDYCHSSPDVAGYRLTPTGDVANVDFGLTAGTTAECNVEQTSSATGGATYSATMQGTSCKLGGEQMVFTTWADTTGHYASLHPTDTGLPTCHLDTGQDCTIVLEQLVWTIDAGSTPKLLRYDDPPLGTFEDMPYCKVDPTAGTFTPDEVLPQRADSSYHTSCLYSTTQKVIKPAAVWFVERTDKVYSAQDGQRQY